jgi:phosphatidylinositol glycan class B
MFSSPRPGLIESPQERFTQRDWIALLAICLLSVVIRASVMALMPSILHPDEVMWIEQANRVVNHQGLVMWDFQVGERSWLWPGVIAAFMALGQLFGSPPAAGLAGVSALLCILSLAPVTCAFLWGRNVAGFAGAVTAALLNAVWYELVYFYAHPISETFASAALVIGLYLVYPDRLVPSTRRLFTGAMFLGLTMVVRPQLTPVIGVAVIAIGGLRLRERYPALLAGLAVPILLSGLLDWVTWGWPFHAYFTYVYDLSVGGVANAFGSPNPFYSYIGWEWVAWGVFGIVVVLCAIYGGLRLPVLLLIVATIFALHSAIGHKEYRYISPALPLLMTLAGIGSVLAAEQLAERLARPEVQRALMVAVPLAWTVASIGLAASPDRIWYWVRSRGSILGPRAVNADKDACGVGIYPNTLWWRFGDYVNLRPGIPLYSAGDTANPIAPNAYNYVLSLQRRNKEQKIDDLPADFAQLGYQQVQCWSDPYSRTLLTERTCLWRRPGTCDPTSAKLLTPDVGEAFEALIRPLGEVP